MPNVRERLIELDAPARLAARDETLFTIDPSLASRRLGWVDLASRAQATVSVVERIASEAIADGFTHALVLGMGGSSLAARVLTTCLPGNGLRVFVLDTSSPDTLAAALDQIDPSTTLVLIASKSGTTIEPLALADVVHARFAQDLDVTEVRARFIAVTDPTTPLADRARSERWRRIVFTPPNVGGRFSALTAFGLLPAALAGVDLDTVLSRAAVMEHACAVSGPDNPAVELAATLAEAIEAGRVELHLELEPRFEPLALWIEQLIGESLGKSGRGLIPVLACASTDAQHATRIAIDLADPTDIGAEFVRWEYATALAGAASDIEPFDQPAVAEAKEITATMLAGESAPTASAPGEVRELISELVPGEHLWLLAYLPETEASSAALDEVAQAVSQSLGISTCVSFGPRYLHSTGQLHKDGPDSGAYLVITAPSTVDFAVPGRPWSLGDLHRAQAHGDVIALSRRGRRVGLIELDGAVDEALTRLRTDLLKACETD